MKKNLENTIATLVANQLNEVKDKEQVSKSKTTKAKGQKTKKQLVKESKEAAKEFSKAKLVELKSKGKKSKKEETIKEVKQQQKPSIIEQVISNREVKYVYPEDITDTLARKKWRQQTRNELHRLEREMFRIKDQNSKEFKNAAKKYEDFKKKVLKPEQVA